VRRTIDWDGDAVTIIDQTALPADYRVLTLRTVDELIDAIRRLAVRGAPALGAAGALGVVLAAREGGDVRVAAQRVAEARPTAVNLSWGVARALEKLDEGAEAVLAEALEILDEDERLNRATSAVAAANRSGAATTCDMAALQSSRFVNVGVSLAMTTTISSQIMGFNYYSGAR
jgi:methylthioribose-1-phosphate isomerase